MNEKREKNIHENQKLKQQLLLKEFGNKTAKACLKMKYQFSAVEVVEYFVILTKCLNERRENLSFPSLSGQNARQVRPVT